jgi:hypothetical protein
MAKSFIPYNNESGWIATTKEVEHVQNGHGGKLEDCQICFPNNTV